MGVNGCKLVKMGGGWQKTGGSAENGWYLVKTGGIWQKEMVVGRKWV